MFQLLTRLDVLWCLSTTGAKASGRKEDDRSSRLGNSAQRTGSMLWRGFLFESETVGRWFSMALDRPKWRFNGLWNLLKGVHETISRSPWCCCLVASFVAGVGYVATVLGVVPLGHNLEAPVEQQPDHLTCVCLCVCVCVVNLVMRVKTWANRFTSCNPSRFNEEYEPHAQNSGNEQQRCLLLPRNCWVGVILLVRFGYGIAAVVVTWLQPLELPAIKFQPVGNPSNARDLTWP